jgi:LysM repeat protein
MNTRTIAPLGRKEDPFFSKDKIAIAVAILILLVSGLFTDGCAPKRVETEVPAQPAAAVEATPTPVTSGSYEVKPGDTLWSIAGRSDIYGDSFEWPLVFKANRDQIQDPDLISPKQVLSINKNISEDEKDRAIKAASDTPAFKSHATARESLPVNYF